MTETSNKSFSQKNLDEAVLKMSQECLFDHNEKDYLECCAKKESKCNIESKPDFSKIEKQINYPEIISLVVIVLLVTCGIYVALRKKWHKKLFLPYKKEIKAIFYGWIIWSLCVFSYVNMFDEYIEYRIWLTLPPICAIGIYVWYRSFVLKNSDETK